jgi:hypothetical protein
MDLLQVLEEEGKMAQGKDSQEKQQAAPKK